MVDQKPSSGASEKPGFVVTYSIADGKVHVPDVHGQSADAARTTLQNASIISVKNANVTTADLKLDGKVKDTNPAAGTWITPATQVIIEVYKYKAPPPTCTTPPPTTAPTTTTAPSTPVTGSSTPTTSPSTPTTSPSTSPSGGLPACSS